MALRPKPSPSALSTLSGTVTNAKDPAFITILGTAKTKSFGDGTQAVVTFAADNQKGDDTLAESTASGDPTANILLNIMTGDRRGAGLWFPRSVRRRPRRTNERIYLIGSEERL